MRLNDDFEIVNIVDEYMVVPVGKRAESYKGLVVLSEAAAYLLGKMEKDLSVDELVELLTEKYNVETEVAVKDVKDMVDSLTELGVIAN